MSTHPKLKSNSFRSDFFLKKSTINYMGCDGRPAKNRPRNNYSMTHIVNVPSTLLKHKAKVPKKERLFMKKEDFVWTFYLFKSTIYYMGAGHGSTKTSFNT